MAEPTKICSLLVCVFFLSIISPGVVTAALRRRFFSSDFFVRAPCMLSGSEVVAALVVHDVPTGGQH